MYETDEGETTLVVCDKCKFASITYICVDAFDNDKNGSIDFKEFLLAIDVTSAGSPEEKLNWAFRYKYTVYNIGINIQYKV